MMASEKHIEQSQLEGLLEKYPILISSSQIKKRIPRVNFKGFKLTKCKNLTDTLDAKSITRIFLDDNLIKLDLPIKRETTEVNYEVNFSNPLRKKSDGQEKEKIIEEIVPAVEQVIEEKAIEEIKEEEVKVQQPPPEPEQPSVVWPPPGKKKSKKNKSKKSSKKTSKIKKSKSYYLSETNPTLVEKPSPSFPWSISKESDELTESTHKGLESELIDPPPIFSEPVIDKTDSKDIKLNTSFENLNKVNFGVGSGGAESKISGAKKPKSKNMFNKSGSGNSPVTPRGIVIIGGVAVTFGYLLWSHFVPNARTVQSSKHEKNKVVVRDLFKQKHPLNKDLKEKDTEKDTKLELVKIGEEYPREPKEILDELKIDDETFKPITEEERTALINRAREALEKRLDPFGQEELNDAPPAEQKAEAPSNTPPPDIPTQRKQIELVGIVSAKNKNIALVNLYTVDYTITLNDDKTLRESKLKAALSKTVPNRLEVTVFDPIEDWSVKAVTKSMSRNEDPTIELVKGDKKFKLRVGQKVLLPEDRPLPEPPSSENDAN